MARHIHSSGPETPCNGSPGLVCGPSDVLRVPG